jgi:hypothetical protein
MQARLVTRNLSHSCVKTTIRAFFAGKPRRGVELATALIAEARTLGPVRPHPLKTRIALMVDARFAAIYRISEDSIRGRLWLKERHATEHFERIEAPMIAIGRRLTRSETGHLWQGCDVWLIMLYYGCRNSESSGPVRPE